MQAKLTSLMCTENLEEMDSNSPIGNILSAVTHEEEEEL